MFGPDHDQAAGLAPDEVHAAVGHDPLVPVGTLGAAAAPDALDPGAEDSADRMLAVAHGTSIRVAPA